MENKIVESRTVTGAYDFNCDQIIIDHHRHGRLLLTEGWGGDEVIGEQYRWRQGLAAKLQPTDSFAVLNHHDQDRPLLDWPGQMVERLAQTKEN